MAQLRRERKKLQAKHIPAKIVWDTSTNQWIKNPELKKKIGDWQKRVKKNVTPTNTRKGGNNKD